MTHLKSEPPIGVNDVSQPVLRRERHREFWVWVLEAVFPALAASARGRASVKRARERIASWNGKSDAQARTP